MLDVEKKPMHPIFPLLYPNLSQVGDSVIIIPRKPMDYHKPHNTNSGALAVICMWSNSISECHSENLKSKVTSGTHFLGFGSFKSISRDKKLNVGSLFKK